MIVRFPYEWFRAKMPLCPDPAIFAEKMTQIGHECVIIDGWTVDKRVVVGAVISVDPHENAEKLKVCRVDVGADELLQIVCGCPTVSAGMNVPVATVGSHLPRLKIKKSKLRGVLSQGMLCSAEDIGLTDTSTGLLVLPENLQVGGPLVENYYATTPILEFDITPNRSDCVSVAGLIRDYQSCYTGTNYQNDLCELPGDIKSSSGCQIRSVHALSFYRADIKVLSNSCPKIVIQRLALSGIQPIHPVVDILNYVMCELGQPMHAYDSRSIEGDLIVSDNFKGSLELLDGTTAKLQEGDCCIVDENGNPHSIAGVMGAERSKVTSSTELCTLESCFFSPKTIAKTNRRVRKSSDASMRFERGVDYKLSGQALAYAISLMQEHGVAQLIAWSYSSGTQVQESCIDFDLDDVKRILGVDIEYEFIINALENLSCNLTRHNNRVKVCPPSYRFDIKSSVDLVEEVIRIYGYNSILEIPEYLDSSMINLHERDSTEMINNHLASCGFHEVITYSFTCQADKERFLIKSDSLELVNPISQNMSLMRTTLVSNLYNVAERNMRLREQSVRIFERASIYDIECSQSDVLAIMTVGLASPTAYLSDDRSLDYYDLQNQIIKLLSMMGLDCIEFRQNSKIEYSESQTSAQIYTSSELIGHISRLKPCFDINDCAVIYAEINIQKIKKHLSNMSYKHYSNQPTITRDITWLLPQNINAGAIINEIEKNNVKYLKKVEIFDIYHTKKFDVDRSVSTRLTFQSMTGSLQEKHIDKSIALIINDVCQTLKLPRVG